VEEFERLYEDKLKKYRRGRDIQERNVTRKIHSYQGHGFVFLYRLYSQLVDDGINYEYSHGFSFI